MNRRGGWQYYEEFVRPKPEPQDMATQFIPKKVMELMMAKPGLEARDAAGSEVAPYLQQAFMGRAVMLECLKDIEKVSVDIGQESILEHGKYLEIEQIQRLLVLAGELIQQGLPSMPCDCGPDELDCPKCNGDLWIPANPNYRTTSSLAVK